MVTRHWCPDDDELLAEIGRARAVIAMIPLRMTRAAKAAYSWRTVDAELATMVSASADLAQIRSDAAQPRLLCFEHGDVGIEIEISRSVVRGQLYPVRTGLITVFTAAGPFADTRTDETGCFVAPWPESGPVRVRCDTQDSSFVTDWVSA